uniref:PDZ domain-containing protein n=1 Tax=Grammatophora oceanica TaxID=210454 RepID=A0A7S1VVE6_9STRA|mmetsp:Transcript_6586/g.9624  ORF Transcript_6586/g.9624 Transcript_6586/m.9624 type:complete len:193 (+) Transcript_6586:141-719(+)|eukprot:CAMPEP_0194049166 /NCGR_PEP_ID=MMETSP0009_2-20130614/29900_1 /TAXON_ID=210454 /ORGANISM="Grammatophora oceanica, Strain CCMP 410" /LENGTH=192 /DNA_ID=CAMNT_0038695251 /DNA_START=130 /DNA_END=708 /DNA_ORIENTATION=+
MKLFLLFASAVTVVSAFAPSSPQCSARVQSTELLAGSNEDLLRQSRVSRQAGSDDNVVELMRPLGLILKENEDTGDVYVETVAPKGNAARTGLVKEGDVVTMCSATFGNQMWSTRGVGLTRVLAAIRVRAGPTVKLVFENPNQAKKRAQVSTAQRKAQEAAREAAQAKKDKLLEELESDEKRLKKGKFLGLF